MLYLSLHYRKTFLKNSDPGPLLVPLFFWNGYFPVERRELTINILVVVKFLNKIMFSLCICVRLIILKFPMSRKSHFSRGVGRGVEVNKMERVTLRLKTFASVGGVVQRVTRFVYLSGTRTYFPRFYTLFHQVFINNSRRLQVLCVFIRSMTGTGVPLSVRTLSVLSF